MLFESALNSHFLTIDLLSFERTIFIALCFCIFWYLQICFLLCCRCLTRLNLEFFLDWSVIECFLGNTISLGCWIVIRTYLIPLILRSISLDLIIVFYPSTCSSLHYLHHLVAYTVPYFEHTWVFELERAWSSIGFMI